MTLPETASSRWAATEGLPFPLGPTRIEEEGAYNFALYSKHAESVTLLLYTESDIVNPVLAYRFDYLKNKTGRIWHCRMPLASMKGASYYAYRVEGPAPNGRFERHGFDRDKILLDPYAKSGPSSCCSATRTGVDRNESKSFGRETRSSWLAMPAISPYVSYVS